MEYSRKLISTKKLIIASLMSALSIILTRYASIILLGGSIRLGFGNLPVIFAGMLLGPAGGALTGAVSDLLGMLISSQGAYHPGFTLSAILTGVIPGIIVYKGSGYTFLKNILANFIVYIGISLFMNTFWLTQVLGKSFFIILPARAVAQGLTAIITVLVIHFLMRYSKYMSL